MFYLSSTDRWTIFEQDENVAREFGVFLIYLEFVSLQLEGTRTLRNILSFAYMYRTDDLPSNVVDNMTY